MDGKVSTLTIIGLLGRSKELVSQGWCQGSSARTAHGDGVDAIAAFACEWCVTGAMKKALYETVMTAERRALHRETMFQWFKNANSINPGTNLVQWNDKTIGSQKQAVDGFQNTIMWIVERLANRGL